MTRVYFLDLSTSLAKLSKIESQACLTHQPVLSKVHNTKYCLINGFVSGVEQIEQTIKKCVLGICIKPSVVCHHYYCR